MKGLNSELERESGLVIMEGKWQGRGLEGAMDVSEFDMAVIVILHHLITDLGCLSSSKLRRAFQLRLESAALSESEDVDRRSGSDMQMR
jgi:hypothetical protein